MLKKNKTTLCAHYKSATHCEAAEAGTCLLFVASSKRPVFGALEVKSSTLVSYKISSAKELRVSYAIFSVS